MIDLTFDVEARKDLLAQFVGDKLQAWGAISSVENVNLRKVLFADQNVPNKDALLASLQDDLANAQKNGMTWLNDVQPELSAVAQCFINYGTLFANTLPTIRAALKQDTPDNRNQLKQIFSGLEKSTAQQVSSLTDIAKTIQDIAGKIAQDAANFSDNNQNFSDLEKIDEENLQEAKAAIQQLSDLIDQYNKEITKNIIKEEEDLTIADIVMSAGGLVGKPGEALGLAIGLFFIVSAGLTVSELISEVNSAFQAAMKEAKYQVAVTELNEQLLCLHQTSSSLQTVVTEFQDMEQTLNAIIQFWNDMGTVMQKAQSELDDTSQPLNEIISEFNLGRASAEWEEAVVFAQKMERSPVSFGKQELVTPAPNMYTTSS